MTSEFAKTLSAKLTADIPPSAVEWGERVIDAELQEVRDVLMLLRRLPDSDTPCWCVVNWANGHDGPCKTTRTIWAKLEIGGKER